MHFLEAGTKILGLKEEMVRWKRSSPAVTGGHHNDAATTSSTTGTVKDNDGAAWEAMFESLKKYQEEHGDCQADQDSSDSELGRWGEFWRSLCGDVSFLFRKKAFEDVMISTMMILCAVDLYH